MRAWAMWLIGAAAVAAAAGAGYWLGERGHGGASKPDQAPQAAAETSMLVPVQSAPVVRKAIAEKVTVYGRVVAQPGDIQVISAPVEANVEHVLATLGQPVARGAPLIRIAPSPATRLALQQAKAAYSAAAQKLTQIRQEYDAHLVVSTQLIDAQMAANTAALHLAALQREGAGEVRTITARSAGTVSEVTVRDGQLVQAGAPLLSVVVRDRVETSLGVEPEDAPSVHLGDRIELIPVNTVARRPIIATVKTKAAQVDPKTQLIDVHASLPRGSGLILGAYVQGQLTTAAQTGLVVPKSAVLPAGGKYKLFTIVHGRAVEHTVAVGVENDKEVEVLDSGLAAGDLVVTEGNYELSNGTPVLNRSGG